jgi:hypothetical protein
MNASWEMSGSRALPSISRGISKRRFMEDREASSSFRGRRSGNIRWEIGSHAGD